MAETTAISWATHTASPWFGCSKVSAGCRHCYAEEMTLKRKWAGWGESEPRVRSKGFWKDAHKWNRGPLKCDTCGVTFKQLAGRQKLCEPIPGDPCKDCNFGHYARPRIFTSLMDPWDAMPGGIVTQAGEKRTRLEVVAEFVHVVWECQNLDWLLLTKRPANCLPTLKEICDLYALAPSVNDAFCIWLDNWLNGDPPSNVWLGVTCENQEMADKRILQLLQIPARLRWLSVEPLLERISFQDDWLCQDSKCGHAKIDWVVVGGESGRYRRDCGVEAIINVAEQCRADGVPVWVKQDVGRFPGLQGRIPDEYWNMKELPKL